MDVQQSLPSRQQTLVNYFPWTNRTSHQKKELPTVIKTLVFSFLKTTVEDEIKSGKQRTMEEFLDEDYPGDLCYQVIIYRGDKSTVYGPYRHEEQALARARDFVKFCPNEHSSIKLLHAEIQVLSYDARFLGDRSGNWCDQEQVFYFVQIGTHINTQTRERK